MSLAGTWCVDFTFLRLALIAVLMLCRCCRRCPLQQQRRCPGICRTSHGTGRPAAAPLPAFGAAGAQISLAAAHREGVVPAGCRRGAPDAPVITATKTDALVPNDLPPARPRLPATSICYTITVVNSGSTDAL